jgi:aspartyl-tRNA(Asn)/glutamyl-tRNA(Gln) amidotransferase subunit B
MKNISITKIILTLIAISGANLLAMGLAPTYSAEYKSGKTKLWGFFVGQAMQKTKGNGNPQIINDLLKKYLS